MIDRATRFRARPSRDRPPRATRFSDRRDFRSIERDVDANLAIEVRARSRDRRGRGSIDARARSIGGVDGARAAAAARRFARARPRARADGARRRRRRRARTRRERDAKARRGAARRRRTRTRARRRAAKQARREAKKATRATTREGETTSASIEAPKTPTLRRIASEEDFRREHAIEIRNACERTRDLEPFTTFDEAAFPKPLRAALKAQGYDAPTPIQAEAWPILLKGKDVVAIAKTGSGKTCGFLLPALASIVARGSQKAPEMQLLDGRWRPGAVTPTVIVLAPTRELAIQIHDECAKFCPAAGCRSAVLYGGAAKGDQLRALRSGADVVVATPGRLNDFLEPPPGFTAPVSAVKASYVVLDEADRMLDMGFEPQIKKIFKLCPSARQTVMFTATWPKAVQKIADSFTTKPIHIQIGSGGDKLTANKSITQTVEVLEEEEKFDRCVAILKKELGKDDTCIMFAGTKRRCDFLDRQVEAVWVFLRRRYSRRQGPIRARDGPRQLSSRSWQHSRRH